MAFKTYDHVCSIWGAEFDDAGMLIKLWVTDSAFRGGLEEWLVQECPVPETYDSHVWFGQEQGDNSYFWGYTPLYFDYLTLDVRDLEGNIPTSLVPEPSAAVLFFAGFLPLVLTRRRRDGEGVRQ